jgi:hypothetical protein
VRQWYNYQNGKKPQQKMRSGALNEQYFAALDWEETPRATKSANLKATLAPKESHTDVDENTVEWMHPMMLAAKAKEENPTWEEAMNDPDKAGYWEACLKEIETIMTHLKVWDAIDREPWMNILPGMWAFKCKRFPDGMIRKLKARFRGCGCGYRQRKNVDFLDTFPPVVNWQTIRLMMIIYSPRTRD